MQIVFLLYEKMTALDFIGPHEVLCRIPGAEIKRVALRAGTIKTDSANLILTAEHAIDDIYQADVLLIPGSGHATSLREYPEILEWVRRTHVTTTWTTSVCTGSLILGAAGLLKGLRATSHWAVLDRLKAWGANPTSKRVVEEGKIMTAAGVSAGIDMALTLTEKIAGSQLAQTIQLGIEYDPEPPFDSGSAQKAQPAIREALRTRLLKNFEKEEPI
jgi:transcriptional regulator GlxA family with amidase domain